MALHFVSCFVEVSHHTAKFPLQRHYVVNFYQDGCSDYLSHKLNSYTAHFEDVQASIVHNIQDITLKLRWDLYFSTHKLCYLLHILSKLLFLKKNTSPWLEKI